MIDLRFVGPYLIMSLPFLYMIAFRKIAKYKKEKVIENRYLFRTTLMYFGAGLLLYIFATGLLYSPGHTYTQEGKRYITWHPDVGFYYMLVSLIVYRSEISVLERNLSAQPRKWKGHYVIVIGYIMSCFLITFGGCTRLREIIYDLRGPAIGIYDTSRVDWMAYRLAAIQTYLSQDMAPFQKLGFLNVRDGIFWYELYNEGLGIYGFQHGWWWLFLPLLPVGATTVWFVKKKWGSGEMKRTGDVLVISYWIRWLIATGTAVFVFNRNLIPFPFFSSTGIMDLMMIVCLLRKNTKEIMLNRAITLGTMDNDISFKKGGTLI